MQTRSKIYVAGHTGLVGSGIMRLLNKEGYQNIIACTHEDLDLTRQWNVEKFFRDECPEYVFLCAARVGGIKANMDYPADFIYDNLAIQTNVIHSAHLYGVKKLLFLGSSCIYPKNAPQPLKEEYLLSGKPEATNESYAIGKIAGIKMCQDYNRQFGTKFMTAIPCNLYGPGDNFDLENSHVLPALIRKFHEAKVNNLPSVEIWGTGTPMREFLYIDDLAEACLQVMWHYEDNEPINIGSGYELSINDIALIIKDIVRYNGKISFNSSMPDGIQRKVLDVTKIIKMGWYQKVGLIEGISKTYQWLLSQI